jgi:DNA repair protein RecO (recombination protein O)
METSGRALVLTLVPHGEHGAVVRFLDFEAGLVAGYVHGARSRKRRADLTPGNRIALRLSVRREGQLATAVVEVEESRALLAFDPAKAAVLDYLVHVPALLFGEEDPCTAFALSLDALIDAMARDDPAWPRRFVQLECRLLEALGLGLDLGRCALTGVTENLAYASPSTGRAVSREAADGQPWQSQLLPVPAFLAGEAAIGSLADGLALTGHFLERHVFSTSPRLRPMRTRALALLPSSRHRPDA